MATAMTGLVRNFGAPSLAKTFNEGDHPRDASGRWTSGDHAVDNATFQPEDEARMHAIDARLDRHLGNIHAARKQAAEHITALKRIGATVEKEHAKALDALTEHNEVLGEYGFAESESTDVDDADEFRSSIDDALDVLKPHVTAAKLK
ncbi:hypothetical protein FF100_29420 [Methylobacterium terricola]|uniref:Uncharacterized protein n=1 Tax=Methylobacterium terricola TaxID=2583531 RepID=A0A5C4LB04_9HYPH|nr:hypothetical protein [Methylobacterium terricola]TNC08455.1 hypothetical protein FF100_29420 [Methylobacterium terricola]